MDEVSRTDFDNHGKRIGIFVIAYNAESHITETLSRIPEDVWRAVEVTYIIDDCSTDETVEKALEFDRWRDKLVVIRNPVNRRYGGNQKVGYQYAIDRALDIVIMLHADGQYAPEHLVTLLTPLVQDEAEVVMGSRMMAKGGALKGGMPLYKYVGNKILTRIENAFTGLGLSEFHSGYRAYSVRLLKHIRFWENADEWHFDTQILLQAQQAGARILEKPIPTYYGDEICRVNGIAYAINVMLSSFFFMLHKRGILYGRKYDVSLHGRRYFEKFSDPYSSHTFIWRHLQALPLQGAKVLELGVGDASLTQRLSEAGALVDGVEIDQESAELARPYCHSIRLHDLNDLAGLDLEEGYDIVIAADVLEHLVEPEAMLSTIKKHLKRGGLLTVSLPNVANAYVRLNLMLGRFPRHTKGILDETHLHFYTLSGMRRLLAKTGWVIKVEEVTSIPLAVVFPFLLKPPFKFLLTIWFGLTRMLKGLFGYQGIFYCTNPNHPHLL